MIEVGAMETGKGGLCREILESLPEWFGIAEAIDDYVAAVEDLPMLAARSEGRIVGFIALKFHTGAAAEAYVLGVRREWHGRGAGRALFAAAERLAAGRGVRLLTVKTLAASHPDPNYAKTRRFYEAIGFLPVEVFPTLWGEGTPCLLMAKPLIPAP